VGGTVGDMVGDMVGAVGRPVGAWTGRQFEQTSRKGVFSSHLARRAQFSGFQVYKGPMINPASSSACAILSVSSIKGLVHLFHDCTDRSTADACSKSEQGAHASGDRWLRPL
jgi:hypothetical protein